MAIYYFDLREGDALAVDEEGLELCDMRAVRAEATRSNGRRGSRCNIEPVCWFARSDFN